MRGVGESAAFLVLKQGDLTELMVASLLSPSQPPAICPLRLSV